MDPQAPRFHAVKFSFDRSQPWLSLRQCLALLLAAAQMLFTGRACLRWHGLSQSGQWAQVIFAARCWLSRSGSLQ